MSRITEYTPVSAFDENDVLIKDGENGTKIISVEDAASEFRRLCGIDGDISDITDSLSAFGTNLAGVETTFIATKNYNIGDLFVIDGVLYRATATIASDSEIDPETNCEETSFSTVIEAMNDILAGKADANGTYDNLIAGNAKQLVGTVFTEDDAAYTFRTAGGSADIGDREYDEIIGGSIVWNQLLDVEESKTIALPSPRAASFGVVNGTEIVAGHKYLFGATISDCENVTHIGYISLFTYHNGSNTSILNKEPTFNTNGTYFVVGEALCDGLADGRTQGDGNVWIYCRLSSNEPDGATATLSNLQLFDLTKMFGPTIADYILGLENATAGAGVAWFRKYFPKEYYEYNAGEIMSVEGLTSHDLVEFNAWDGEWEVGSIDSNTGENIVSESWRSKNFIPIFPSTAYHSYSPTYLPATTNNNIRPRFYDSDKNYIGYKPKSGSTTINSTFITPDNAHFMRFTPSNDLMSSHELCINLSWDGERDGEYEPYVKHSYPLDPTLTLRGIPVLSGGNLAYDGDRYKADGTVERRYGIVDLGTLNWAKNGETSFKSSVIADIKPNKNSGSLCNAICDKYPQVPYTSLASLEKCFCVIWSSSSTAKTVYFRDTSYDNAESFKEAMSGVYLVYELEEPTTETATAYQSPQIVDDFGTEEYVTTSIVPVGHETKYDSNLRAKLEMVPNSPDGDGDYLVRQTSGQNEYIPYTDGGRITTLEGKIPSPPSTDGAYVLTCTVADGTPTYSWVSA